ncbi:GerMN domain-containing protein [Paenibacillus donghaensis]|uniref:GerMN domain-containing protein n=1 Tax=Paenibacillus donghaensis TaxID=414771 RepID=A0A2Z2KDU7_9BACL|nr:GerMN domain-containing protein [Paenibacillus donghaensis]ASA23847.1 hypothetical protein B9T62_25535 [Paenibacillus donghaensis]
MKSSKPIRRVSAACLLAVPLALSGCGLFGSESASIDPPPSAMEAQMLEVSGTPVEDAGVLGPVTLDGTESVATVLPPSGLAAGVQTTVFLKDGNGLLAPVSLSLPKGEKNAVLKDSLTALISKGAYAKSLPEGFTGVLPAGTEVESVTVDASKLAVVEFNAEFADYDPASERSILEAITWTLTGQEGIQGVQLWVDGKKLTEMPLQGIPLDRALTRSMGINLPKQGPLLSSSTAVTVFFSATSPQGLPYYVPVTRYVPAGEEQLKAALNELIVGPEEGDGLEMVMTQDTQLESVEAGQNGVVTVALKDDMFADAKDVPEELLESVVLTIAQNTDDSMVQIRLNGKETVISSNNVDYGKPVSAPEFVNELSL